MTLLNGDNYELLKQMPDNSIDAVVTDPPYGLGEAPDALAMLRDWLETGHHDVKSKRGSTGVACKEEGFQFIGMEQDFGYYLIACQRNKVELPEM